MTASALSAAEIEAVVVGQVRALLRQPEVALLMRDLGATRPDAVGTAA